MKSIEEEANRKSDLTNRYYQLEKERNEKLGEIREYLKNFEQKLPKNRITSPTATSTPPSHVVRSSSLSVIQSFKSISFWIIFLTPLFVFLLFVIFSLT
mgnify:CR=1 FL=1